MTGIGIIGCGFVSDLYMQSLRRYPELTLIGVFDRDEERAAQYSAYHNVPRYDSIEALLRDDRITIVVNLTNPRSHFAVSAECLRAGKHVYSEKPLAMEIGEAKQLIELAASRGLWISSAPCSLLGETAQTMWRALREGQLGDVRVAYAELDDGLVHLMPFNRWISASGAPWPYKDEFEVGCTLEHAGYYLTWLVAFFGPVRAMSAWASVQVHEKIRDVKLDATAPDFSVACMRFESGISARLTCSILAPHDHQLRIVGDRAVLATKDCWRYRSPVTLRRMVHIRRRQLYLPWTNQVALLGRNNPKIPVTGSAQMDWCRGVVDLADAIRTGRKPRLAPDFCLHVLELALAMHNSDCGTGVIPITTSFEPIDPMAWAK